MSIYFLRLNVAVQRSPVQRGPTLAVAQSPHFIERFSADQIGFAITSRDLLVHSQLSAKDLVYFVKQQPHNGRLMLAGSSAEDVVEQLTAFR